MKLVAGCPTNSQHVPIHRLNTTLTKCWFLGGVLRRQVCNALAHRYESGCGVLTDTMWLIAYVDPHGRERELTAPFKKYEIYQIANQPTVNECPCADFYDPKMGGPWSVNHPNLHHPLCQYEPASKKVFETLWKMGKPLDRGDGWDRLRKEYRGR
jgi:hypothetical protein